MIRLFLPCVIVFALLASPVLAADDSSRYEDLVQSQEHLTTIRSLAVAMMSLPYDRENVVRQLHEHLWANKPDAKLNDATRELENAKLGNQLKTIEKLMVEYEADSLDLIGFTQVGSMNYLDLYYSFETPKGPVVIRASMYFMKGGGRIFGFVPFEGWDKVRDLQGQIQYRAGKAIASVKLKLPKKEDNDGL
ncbi:MAG: hypothetical protein WD768_01145 [Phycisphaeraceae bacterium]